VKNPPSTAAPSARSSPAKPSGNSDPKNGAQASRPRIETNLSGQTPILRQKSGCAASKSDDSQLPPLFSDKRICKFPNRVHRTNDEAPSTPPASGTPGRRR
jgi:hypothetical protein